MSRSSHDSGGRSIRLCEQTIAIDAVVAVTLMAAQSSKPLPALERLVELCRARKATGRPTR